jgi:hypothetical protein
MADQSGSFVKLNGVDQSARAKLQFTDGKTCAKKSGLGGVTSKTVPKDSQNHVEGSPSKR